MSKFTIYVPDDIYKDVKEAGLPVSEVCRLALQQELAVRSTPPEGAEIMPALHKWLRQGRALIAQFEDFLA